MKREKMSDCSKKYFGQTRRAINTRFKQHVAHYKHNKFEKCTVAQHIPILETISSKDTKKRPLSSTEDGNPFAKTHI